MSGNPRKNKRSISSSRGEHDPYHKNFKSRRVQRQLLDTFMKIHLPRNHDLLEWLSKSLLIFFMPGQIYEGTEFTKFDIKSEPTTLREYSNHLESAKKCDVMFSASFEYLNSSNEKVSNEVTCIMQFQKRYQLEDATRFKIYYNLAAERQKGNLLYMVIVYDELIGKKHKSTFPENQFHQRVEVFSCPCRLVRETIEEAEFKWRTDQQAPKVIEIGPESVKEGKPTKLPKNAYYFFTLLFWPNEFEKKVENEKIELPRFVIEFWREIQEVRSVDDICPEIPQICKISKDESLNLSTLARKIIATGAHLEKPVSTTKVEKVKKLFDSFECEVAKRTWFQVCALIFALLCSKSPSSPSLGEESIFVRSFIENVGSDIIVRADCYCRSKFPVNQLE